MEKRSPYSKSQGTTGPIRAWTLAAFLLIVLPSLVLASEPSPKTKKAGGDRVGVNRKEPIFIAADHMEVDRKKNTIIYRGNVVTTQGEMTMQGETLTAIYSPDMKGLQTVVTEGKVHISQSGRTATGSKAVFNGQEQTITLTGNPVIHQGNSQISGSRIVFFIEEDRVTVEGGKERVKAKVFPDELEQQKRQETKPAKNS